MQDTTMKTEKQMAHPLVKAMYPGRVLINTAGLLVLISIFYKDTNILLWTYIIGMTVLWPHIAFLISKHSKDPRKSVVRNLIIDSFLWGTVLNIYSLSLLPSVAIIVGTASTNILSGGFQLLLRRLGFPPGIFDMWPFHWI